MTRTLLDVATFAVYGVCAGYAGWWAHDFVARRRLRRIVAEVLADERMRA